MESVFLIILLRSETQIELDSLLSQYYVYVYYCLSHTPEITYSHNFKQTSQYQCLSKSEHACKVYALFLEDSCFLLRHY